MRVSERADLFGNPSAGACMSAIPMPTVVAAPRLSDVVTALSYALDITEGQPEGHAARTCMIGMRIAREIFLMPRQRSALFYALLLKDLGCSSNAAKVCYLFAADDRRLKADLKTASWTGFFGRLAYIVTHVAPQAGLLGRLKQFAHVARNGEAAARELIELRCDRGASIARMIGLPAETATAIRSLDEHWDGGGHPQRLSGEGIPILARIACLAQTVEVFLRRDGLAAALAVAQRRAGTWFDPDLVRALMAAKGDGAFWQCVTGPNPAAEARRFEPPAEFLAADDEALDRVAAGFSHVIDAKSPWTFCHSQGVAELAQGIATTLGCAPAFTRSLRRAALLHDIGKLGISNLLLDKPGKLTADEAAVMRTHTQHTRQILSRIPGLSGIAEMAAAHHERLDGRGYDRGVPASEIPPGARILAVADMYEALSAKRPYRKDLTDEDARDILRAQAGAGLDPEVVAALECFLDRSSWQPIKLAA
jgi:putative nucleotidyltransferase with HDIG domain